MITLPDFATLLRPITLDNPAGDNLEYDSIFDEIRLARESDPSFLPQDDWAVSDPKKADWGRVCSLSEQALREKSKDLQLACWLVEALAHRHGVPGLIAGIDFLNAFITQFWFHCWPSLEDDGLTIRRARLVRLDRDVSQLLFCLPLLEQEISSLAHWKQTQAFEHKISVAPERRDELISQEGDLTVATFESQASSFSAREIDQQAAQVKTLTAALAQLNAHYLSLSQDPEGELFTHSRQMVKDIADYLQRLAPRVSYQMDEMPLSPPDKYPEEGDVKSVAAQSRMQITDREMAVKQMLAIAHYFRQTEPSSPVPFLMERAARWANMTLTEWLEEMLNDSSSMRDINLVLTGQLSQ
ncbi:type VI secretion system protein TssA [Citrobacter youngae]|uniref:Type VI secretion-associated protein, ImpA family n=1 Tax=Citrobacter youngae ATCC 29220 TaxID=500640 RepID=D4B7Q7_9ENTR|nr:type VI secretion system protein TssA [Citrobacter youngae]EFE10410.1 type VI secretion-associated protein, ImpA family [Citrobacter youngae ATCC 29220]